MTIEPKLFALHRYFIWADRMRVHFDEALRVRKKDQDPLDIDTFLYMSYWYGAMYVVVEGWSSLGLDDPVIDDLLKSENVALLRRYRNGVFHFQVDYYDEKRFVPFIAEAEDSARWIRELREGFSRYFLQLFPPPTK